MLSTLLPALVLAAAIDPKLLASSGEQQFFVVLNQPTDTAKYARGQTGDARLLAVYQALRARSIAADGLALRLQSEGRLVERFWLVNALLVRGDAAYAKTLARDPQVQQVLSNPTLQFKTPPLEFSAKATLAVTPGQTLIGAPRMWAAGIRGAGVVVAGEDTGYAWQHPALKNSYRGWNGTTADHNYNWFDGITSGTGGSCGINASAPCDDGSHGTHTMGTMVGDDGANEQIGSAPAAKWIGCRNMDQGNGTPATYLRCMQWMLAPTDLAGNNPNPLLAPHVINNSWGCPPSEGCVVPDILREGIANLRSAGILFVASAGNGGSTCNTIVDAPAFYPESFSVGSTTLSDVMSGFSSRGPVTIYTNNPLKPDVSAPGSSIRSSVPPAGYGNSSGTSMAGPHVAGAAALLMSAYPALKRNPEAVEALLKASATQITLTQSCGGVALGVWPNPVAGHGRIDVYKAYLRADTYMQHGFEN